MRLLRRCAHRNNDACHREGIEAAKQRQYLLAARCGHGQGYWFSRPLPEAELEKFVQQAPSGKVIPISQ